MNVAVGLTALLAAIGAATPAGAATEIGQLSTETDVNAGACFGNNSTWLQNSTGPAPGYEVPDGGGVITSWAAKFGGTAPEPKVKLKVFRRTAMITQFDTVGSSAAESLTSQSGTNTFPTRIPVEGGELLGRTNVSGEPQGCFTGSTGDELYLGSGDPTIGALFTANPVGTYRLNLVATVEPDTDRDGFGDETQDQCAGDPAAQGACPSPASPSIPAPPPATSPPAAIDRTAPTLALGGPRSQDVVAQRGSIVIDVLSGEAVTDTVTGGVSVPSLSKVYRFKRVRRPVPANRRVRFRLKLSRAAFAQVRRALGRGRRLRAKVTVVAVDRAGNRSVRRRTIRLRD